MSRLSTRSIDAIEQRMAGAEEGSVRHRVLASAKNFKTSWIELGQSLYSVWKDKLYKEWGFGGFDTYTSKEIGIKKATAMKLLKSYYFLEKEEPVYLEKDYASSRAASAVASLDSVNVLRLAKRHSELDREDYERLKKGVLEMGREPSDAKKDLTALIRQREELEPDEARKRRRETVIKRTIASLKTLKRDVEVSKMLPSSIVKEISTLINKLELEVGR